MELETLVRNFRKAIEDAQTNYEPGSFFRKFPTRQCGHTSDMLAQYLIDNGIGPITYVSGTYYGDDPEDSWHHAWLVLDGLVIDITGDQCQRHFKMSIFAEMGCRFLQGSIQVLCSLIHHITCRFEARQALIYQLASGLTGENGKYNYSKAVHLYPPFFDIFCSPKNYKTASALTISSDIIPPL